MTFEMTTHGRKEQILLCDGLTAAIRCRQGMLRDALLRHNNEEVLKIKQMLDQLFRLQDQKKKLAS